MFGVCTRLSPPYTRRRAAGIGIRIHLLSAARLVRCPEGTSGTPYACNPTRCCMCGTPSSSRPCRVCLHRKRSDGDVIPSLVFKDQVASGVVEDLRRIKDRRVRLDQPRSCVNVSRLNELHIDMLPISLHYLHQHSIGLGFRHRISWKNYCFLHRAPTVIMLYVLMHFHIIYNLFGLTY